MSVEKRRLQISWTDLQFFRSENVSILLSGIDSKGRLGETAIWEIGKKLRLSWIHCMIKSGNWYMCWRSRSPARSCMQLNNLVGRPIEIFQMFLLFFAAQWTDPLYRKTDSMFSIVYNKKAAESVRVNRKAANSLSFVHLIAASLDLTTCINVQLPSTLVWICIFWLVFSYKKVA